MLDAPADNREAHARASRSPPGYADWGGRRAGHQQSSQGHWQQQGPQTHHETPPQRYQTSASWAEAAFGFAPRGTPRGTAH